MRVLGITIFVVLSVFSPSCKTQQPVTFLAIEYRTLAGITDIISLQDTLVHPLIYDGNISLETLSVEEKKQKFIDLILPAILVAKHHIDQDRQLIVSIKNKMEAGLNLSETDDQTYKRFLSIYKAKDVNTLLRRMYTPPVSIVLAQASIESGWGTSRFFTEANNVFGIWSYQGDGSEKIKSKSHRNGTHIYLKKYGDLSASIYDYFQTLGRVPAYQEFRIKNEQNADPMELIKYLNRYSELGHEYVEKLATVMRVNNLTRFDKYQLHPAYFVIKTEGPGWFASM